MEKVTYIPWCRLGYSWKKAYRFSGFLNQIIIFFLVPNPTFCSQQAITKDFPNPLFTKGVIHSPKDPSTSTNSLFRFDAFSFEENDDFHWEKNERILLDLILWMLILRSAWVVWSPYCPPLIYIGWYFLGSSFFQDCADKSSLHPSSIQSKLGSLMPVRGLQLREIPVYCA